MSHQIIQQPDGKLAVFSSVVDTWIVRDATAEELVAWFVERAIEQARVETRRIVDAVLSGHADAVYRSSFVMTFEEADAIARRAGL
jgi:hypothetical protein